MEYGLTQFDVYKTIIIYVLIINIIGYLSMWNDKRYAQNGQWRISEKTLLLIALIGGSIGSFIAMRRFHHKTKHIKFKYGIPLIFFIQILAIVMYKWNLYIPLLEHLKNIK